MRQIRNIGMAAVVVMGVIFAGCVERKLTIVTEPAGAVVWLNDEEIGTAPVTVNFNWYGDYRVQITKEGYETLNTHRLLERPLHDQPGLDFFAEVLWPGRIVDEYTWDFALNPYQQPDTAQLVEQAEAMRVRAENELGKVALKILKEEEASK